MEVIEIQFRHDINRLDNGMIVGSVKIDLAKARQV